MGFAYAIAGENEPEEICVGVRCAKYGAAWW